MDNEIVIHGTDDLFARLQPVFGETVQTGPVGNFYNLIRMLKDPKICNCKKGKRLEEDVLRSYMSIPSQVRFLPNYGDIKKILGEGVIVFKHEGNVIGRV